jgi:O-antigen/teichoic acid export membrane protein
LESSIRRLITRGVQRAITWRPGAYLRTSGGLYVWLLVRAAGQVALFFAMARTFGAAGYGCFVATMAVVSFFTPFATVGLIGPLLRDCARRPEELAAQVGSILTLWICLTPVLSIAAILTVEWAVPTPLPLIDVTIFALGEIGGVSLVELLARAEQSKNNLSKFGAWNAGAVIVRSLGFILYAGIANSNPAEWMFYNGLVSIAYTLMLWLVAGKPRPIPVSYQKLKTLSSEGFPFALASLSMRVQGEFNKPVLARMGFVAAGEFSAAQRMIDLVSLPLVALQEALNPRFYASKNPRSQVLVAGAFLLAVAFASGLLVSVSAPYIPRILGLDFGDMALILPWLAWLPVVQTGRGLLCMQCVNNHKNNVITRAYVGAAVFGIVITPLLVGSHGLMGAIVAAYATELVTVILLLSKPALSRSKKINPRLTANCRS